jgi:O-antigen/teichoic acid export membrane protein
LLGFFILGSAYYYNLLPEISKFQKKNFIIKKKIIKNFKSLNIILTFCIAGSFLFIENFFYDLNLNSLFKIENFLIFKIIIIATYFNMLNQIFLSFQIANSHFKTPTAINYIIIIFSLLISFPLFNLFGVEGISYLYLSMNFINFFCNLIILSFIHNKIFSKKIVLNFFKIIFFDFFFIVLGLIILYFLFYNLSKILFYIIFALLFFYFFYLSQKFLKKNI